MNAKVSKQKIRPDSNPYRNSSFLKVLDNRLNKNLPLQIAFLDIDRTLIGNGDSQLSFKTRKILAEQGYIFAAVTSRTEEMTISEEEYHLSKKKYIFPRPPPKPSAEAAGILDADIIAASSGTKLLIHQIGGGYLEDIEYRQRFGASPQIWRTAVISLINKINSSHKLAKFFLPENKNHYFQGKTDIFSPPLDFRINLFFTSIEDKLHFTREFERMKTIKNTLDLRLTDDSDPDKKIYSIYITPRLGYKRTAIEWVIDKTCLALNVKRKDLKLLIAGDSWPDLEMGLFSGNAIKNITFVIVGGSRLAPYLTEKERRQFAGEDLFSIKRFLKTDKEKGVYKFMMPGYERKVIIGDLAFPGKKGPETLLCYFQT